MSSFFRKDLTSLFLNSLPLSDLIELSFLLLKTIEVRNIAYLVVKPRITKTIKKERKITKKETKSSRFKFKTVTWSELRTYAIISNEIIRILTKGSVSSLITCEILKDV
jgi:hypothetical protein